MTIDEALAYIAKLEMLDALVAECVDHDGSPKAPSKQIIMRSRGLLPPHCSQSFSKKQETNNPSS